jgi:hypothetical protein
MMNSLNEDECASVHCPVEMMHSYRSLALTGFEMEVLQRFDFVHNEHGVVYVHLESKGAGDFVRIRCAAFDCVLKYMGLSEGFCLDDGEVDELTSNIEDFIQADGELLESDDTIQMLERVA